VKTILVTYASPAFRHRQAFLAASARANGVVDQVRFFSPKEVVKAGFHQRFPDFRLSERGSGFWSWKPFIIGEVMSQATDGDLVFYCDVGRGFPFKLLTNCLSPLIAWMEAENQEVLPGVEIPWDGPMSMWIKRDALVLAGMDHPWVHQSPPIQASFSLWRVGAGARALVNEWTELCSDRRMISDDPSVCGVEELPDFKDHRHDQALLTLCCLRRGLHGIRVGTERPLFDAKHPSEVAEWLDPRIRQKTGALGRLIGTMATGVARLEAGLRKMNTGT
jgi:hypothetical protein